MLTPLILTRVPPWDRAAPEPKKTGAKLSPAAKAKAGRRYPSLVNNMWSRASQHMTSACGDEDRVMSNHQSGAPCSTMTGANRARSSSPATESSH